MWQKGLLWWCRIQRVLPTQGRGKHAPTGCPHVALQLPLFLSCSSSPPSSLDLFFRWLFDTHFLDEADIKFQ